MAMTKKTKMTIIAACVTLIVALGAITLVVKHKQDVANEKAEMAKIEQQQTEMKAELDAKLDDATRLLKAGMDKENDNYEQLLIKAYNAFTDAETTAQKNSADNTQLKAIAEKKKTVVEALNSAAKELSQQVVALEELGETELAATYKDRVNKINEFQTKIK